MDRGDADDFPGLPIAEDGGDGTRVVENALRQTGWSTAPLTLETWRGAVRERLQRVEWAQAVTDVRPFLETGADAALLTPENLVGLLIDN